LQAFAFTGTGFKIATQRKKLRNSLNNSQKQTIKGITWRTNLQAGFVMRRFPTHWGISKNGDDLFRVEVVAHPVSTRPLTTMDRER
jgi:hypothetical protein